MVLAWLALTSYFQFGMICTDLFRSVLFLVDDSPYPERCQYDYKGILKGGTEPIAGHNASVIA